ncbi:hypothetical protein ACP4OV_016477 [Aristida adscensionis]
MFRWGKRSPAPASSGEVAVQKVDKIEVHNLQVMRPSVYGVSRITPRGGVGGGGGAEKIDFDKKAAEFIHRKKWTHGQNPVDLLAQKSFNQGAEVPIYSEVPIGPPPRDD